MPTDTIDIARQLIREESVSPADGNCQAIIATFLQDLGFKVEHLPFGPVKNLWAVLPGLSTQNSQPDQNSQAPLLVLAGHTDVVPTGPTDEWQYPPFDARLEGGFIHGRGAADMKGSIAAMLTGAQRFIDQLAGKGFNGSLAFLITSDEEDKAVDGTVKVIEELASRGVSIDYCLIGEPSSTARLGDVVRVGRRGSLSGKLTVKGIQGHVAYPQDVDNPIHRFAPCLAELAAQTWDEGNNVFPPTSFQVSNLASGTGAGNVVPGELQAHFNFRFSTESTAESLRERVQAIINKHGLDHSLQWELSGLPFITQGGSLIPAVQKAIKNRCGLDTELSTSGGTSDGRFIAPTGTEVVELGPCNASIHKINERVSAQELQDLSLLYTDILDALLGKGSPE